MSHFIYFVCIKENKDLLKKELELFYPELKPSFSKGEFLTYKSPEDFILKKLKPCFALDWGINQGVDQDSITEKIQNTKSSIELPSNAPSRAYLKIAQTCEKYKITDPNLNWIEFGSSPGGASLYLLNNYNQLIGVDPALMDKKIDDNKNFTHIKRPIQNLKESDFDGLNIDYITSDLNLNPKQAIAEVIRLSKNLEVKAIFMTIKMVKIDHIQHIPKFVKSFSTAGFNQIECCQLPAHKREFLLSAFRN